MMIVKGSKKVSSCSFLLLGLLLSLFSPVSAQGVTRKVLFIGNSYTEVNNLPLMVKLVAADMGDIVDYQSHTPGGCTFQQHCSNQSMALIRQGGWDAVVLQEQSQLPSFPQGQVEQQCFPYAARLVDSVYACNPCAEPVFYMTWGRENGDTRNAAVFPVLGSYWGMDSMLYVRYMQMAADNDASVSPVGRVWRALRVSNPDWQLYAADGSHPSLLGSYAAACCFYAVLFRRSPQPAEYTAGLDFDVAHRVCHVVDSVVTSSLHLWLRTPPVAAFSVEPLENGFEVQLHNESLFADQFLWQFGDGLSSSLTDPLHQYADTGAYPIWLTASRHCMSDSVMHLFHVTCSQDTGTASLAVNGGLSLRLFPNPTRSMLTVTANGLFRAEVYTLKGERCFHSDWVFRRTDLNLYHLPQGVYLLRIVDRQGRSASRSFIKSSLSPCGY